MTLVFAENRSLDALKEALFAKRTVAFFADEMAGPEALLSQLFSASVNVHQPFNVENGTAHFEISNPTDLTFILENKTPAGGAPGKIEIAPRSSVIAQCNLEDGKAVLPYEVTNLYTGKTSNLTVELEVME